MTQLENQVAEWLEKTAQEITAAINSFRKSTVQPNNDLAERIKALRDEAARAKDSDLPALFDQLNSLKALFNRKSPVGTPNPNSPFFAHLRLCEQGCERDILLGHKTFLEYKTPIIDWRHAPVAKIFFKYRIGDEYEERLPGRLAKGIVIQRHIVSFKNGELSAIITPKRTLVKTEANWSIDEMGASPQLRGGVGTAHRGHPIGTRQSGGISLEISALLDKSQYEILTRDTNEPLLILGGAGSGKTTVATHRLAHLNFKDPQNYSEKKLAVIVPDPGLAALTANLLDGLKMKNASSLTYEDWVIRSGRRQIKGLPRKVCKQTPPAAIKFKKHKAILQAIYQLINDEWEELATIVEKKFKSKKDMPTFIRDQASTSNISDTLKKIRSEHLKNISAKNRQKIINQFFVLLKVQQKKYRYLR